MSSRSRRWLAALAVIVLLLFVGRWSAGFLTERWWARTISPAIETFVSGWQLLGLALDAAAVMAASLWFAVQALLVTRSVVSVQVAHRVGDLQLRELIAPRVLVVAALASGVLLGLIAGTGAHAWRDPIVLAWQGVHYGVRDPILGQDVGVYVAQLPAWDLAERFIALLVFLALALCTTLYTAIGGVRRVRWTLTLHPDTQRHLGTLLALMAIVISVAYQLVPFHVVVHATPALTPADAMLRVRGAQIMSGLAIAAAILTGWWAFRGRGALLVSTWLVLGAGALIEAIGLPSETPAVAPLPSRLAEARRIDAIAWGMHVSPAQASSDTIPAVTSLWDDALLARVVERAERVLEAATPSLVSMDEHDVPVWLAAAASATNARSLDVFAMADAPDTSRGVALHQRSTGSQQPWADVSHARILPSAPSWTAVPTGVDVRGSLRRLLLAWARQAPGMLQPAVAPAVDWHLDPVERADAVLPMLSWTAAEIAMVNGRVTWIVQGLTVTADFPLATRALWRGEDVAGVVPAVVAAIDASTGSTQFYLDPAADSLGVAWARVAGVVASASTMPPSVRQALRYDPAWFNAQADVLAGPTWNTGRRNPARDAGPPSVPVWTDEEHPAREAAFEDPAADVVTALAVAYRADGVPQLRLDTSEASEALAESPEHLHQLWTRSPMLEHLRDSVIAAGDSVLVGPIRWFAGRLGFAAWQPWFAKPRRGATSLLWVATALGDRSGGGRRPAEAWDYVTAPVAPTANAAPDVESLLGTAREWMARADSALRRGDMTAFGRAFEALRRTLQGSPEP